MDVVVFINPKDKQNKHGKTFVEVKAPPIHVNLSPVVYNRLVNIHKMFLIKDQKTWVLEKLTEKYDIIKDSILVTAAKLKTAGEKFSDAYIILSNNYLYSYPLLNSVNPEIKLFIKDAIIED